MSRRRPAGAELALGPQGLRPAEAGKPRGRGRGLMMNRRRLTSAIVVLLAAVAALFVLSRPCSETDAPFLGRQDYLAEFHVRLFLRQLTPPSAGSSVNAFLSKSAF